jgi:hypothetical protein
MAMGKIPNTSKSCWLNLACEGIFLVDHMHRARALIAGDEILLHGGREKDFPPFLLLTMDTSSHVD